MPGKHMPLFGVFFGELTSCFIFCGCRTPTGGTSIKRRHLGLLGYRLVTVPFWVRRVCVCVVCVCSVCGVARSRARALLPPPLLSLRALLCATFRLVRVGAWRD